MKFVSWNVNGLRACMKKDFMGSFTLLDADAFCLQETKMLPEQADFTLPGYQMYWNSAEKKGNSGTANFTRNPPLSESYDIGDDCHVGEGRSITLEFEEYYLVTVYTPNSQDGLRRLDYRMEWEEAFRAYLQELDTRKPVVVCGIQPGKSRLFRRGTGKVFSAFGLRVYRHLPIFESGADGGLLLVELSIPCPGEQRGVADRLLPGLRSAQGTDKHGGNPYRYLRQ